MWYSQWQQVVDKVNELNHYFVNIRYKDRFAEHIIMNDFENQKYNENNTELDNLSNILQNSINEITKYRYNQFTKKELEEKLSVGEMLFSLIQYCRELYNPANWQNCIISFADKDKFDILSKIKDKDEKIAKKERQQLFDYVITEVCFENSMLNDIKLYRDQAQNTIQMYFKAGVCKKFDTQKLSEKIDKWTEIIDKNDFNDDEQWRTLREIHYLYTHEIDLFLHSNKIWLDRREGDPTQCYDLEDIAKFFDFYNYIEIRTEPYADKEEMNVSIFSHQYNNWKNETVLYKEYACGKENPFKIVSEIPIKFCNAPQVLKQKQDY